MKLIIDISQNDYEEIKEYGINTFPSVAIAIQNGKPLNKELKKIRTKIDSLPTMSCNSIGCSYIWAKDYKIDILSILDKSIEESK